MINVGGEGDTSEIDLKKWNALPEYFVEDIAEFLLFYLQ